MCLIPKLWLSTIACDLYILTRFSPFLEGALYPDGTSGRNKNDDMVPPGKNYTYVWPVREEYAPAPADANCLTWVYHSHIDAPKDICSGLIGPLLVCKEGKEAPHPLPQPPRSLFPSVLKSVCELQVLSCLPPLCHTECASSSIFS